MRGLLVLLVCANATACVKLGGGGDGGEGTGASGVAGGDAGTAPTGAGCFQEQQTGTTLCAAFSLCPNVLVDGELYPNCGFRVRGMAIDLECGCSDALCSMGIASTCAQAKQLLDSQNEALVCAQLSAGRCVATTPTGGGSLPTCDAACRSECGGDPGCVTLCGC